MDLKSLFNKGKKIVDERGGVESLKDDAAELTKIAKGKGSLTDKAKQAADALKDPGAKGSEVKATNPAPADKPQGEGQQSKPQQP
jgi:hypothetical protein